MWNIFSKQWGKMQRNTPKVSNLISGLKYTVYQCERLGLLNCNLRDAKLHDAEIRNVIKKPYEKFNSNDVFSIGQPDRQNSFTSLSPICLGKELAKEPEEAIEERCGI